MGTTSKSKLTLWVDKKAGQFGKEWAKQHHASLSQLVTDYLLRLRTVEEPSSLGPMVKKLSGVLKGRRPDKGVYQKYLVKKYLGS